MTTKPKNLARRERLNPDWPITVFSYDAWPVGDLPAHLWETAKLQQNLWNDLVTVFERARAADVEGLSKDERKAIYTPVFDLKGLRAIAQAYKGLLPSGYYYAIVDRFLVTAKNWRKNPKANGAPRKKFRLERVSFPLVLSDGRPAEWLQMTSTATQAAHVHDTRSLKRLGGDVYRLNGWFDVGARRERVDLHVAYHRPIPATGRIKRVTLAGTFEPSLGPGRWRWQLQVQVEHPAPEALPPTGRVAGLDLGWRVREDSLRVGYLTDNGGNRYELLLPLAFGNANARRRARWLSDRGLEPGTPLDYRSLADLQAVEDGLLEACKGVLAGLGESVTAAWPDEARRKLAHLPKMRAAGLRRLLGLLGEAQITDAGADALAEWQAKSSVLRRRIRGAQLDADAARKDYYRKLARWIAVNFDALAWEGELGLKELAEDTPDEWALRNAKRYRQIASLSTLRLYIGQAMRKAGRTLTDGGTAYSSQVCPVCGGHVEPSSKLLRVCENGHRSDQDEVASRNLLSTLEAAAGISPGAARIPDDLRRCLRAVATNEW